MNSNEDKLYTKVIVLSIIYNFVVEIFFYLKSFSVINLISNFKFQNL